MAMRKPRYINMEDYWDNRSTTLIYRYDNTLRRVRLETYGEREERLLRQPHTHQGYVGTQTFLEADKTNRDNLSRPITSKFIDIDDADEEEQEMEEAMTEDIVTYNEDNSRTKWHEIWEQHPLWYRPEDIRTNTWLKDSRTALEVDRFGYNELLVQQIRELYAEKLSPVSSKNISRQPHTDEKILLCTQIALSSFLSVNRSSAKGNAMRKKAILHMVKRLNLSMVTNRAIEHINNHRGVTPNMDTLANRLSSNCNNWFSALGIVPSDIRTGYPSRNTRTVMGNKERKETRMDYELLLSYGFTHEESAEIVGTITGQTRSHKTIREWGLDGSPREKKQPTQQEREPMTTNAYESNSTSASQSQGIDAQEMLIQMATAMANGGMVALIKEAMDLYEIAKVEAKAEIDQRGSTEVKRLQEELQQVENFKDLYETSLEECRQLKKQLAEKEAELESISKDLQASALGGANIENRIHDILKGNV